ncbi:MAG: hypothetical protein GY862_21575 [Gammaproteobacteria bacterium]|nr:hypothetical protein [Gammaproteobacteria bacterium]
MSNSITNSGMVFDENESDKLIDTGKEVMTLAVILLICAHKAEFLRFSDYAKSLILKIFDDDVRHNFRKRMNV